MHRRQQWQILIVDGCPCIGVTEQGVGVAEAVVGLGDRVVVGGIIRSRRTM
jgi:hypothetical protein